MKHFLILSFVIISVGANAQKFRQEIQDYNSVVNLRNETLAPKKNDKAFIQTTKHLYSYDLGNTTSPDDGLKYIVQTLGSYRWVCLNCHLRVELSQDSILLQYDANDILVQRDTIRLLKGADKFHSNIVGTASYDPLLPLSGWVAPSSPITGNTVEVKFTDGTVGNYTFDGTDWVLDFVDDTSTAQRPWIKVGNTTETSATDVLKTDEIYHLADVRIGSSDAPLANLHVGDRSVSNSTSSKILISSTVNQTGVAEHGFSDSSLLMNGENYNSYDARVVIQNSITGGSDSHYASFQSGPTLNTGVTLDNYYGYFDAKIGNGNISNYYGFYTRAPQVATNYTGLYVNGVQLNAATQTSYGANIFSIRGVDATGINLHSINGSNSTKGLNIFGLLGNNVRPIYTINELTRYAPNEFNYFGNGSTDALLLSRGGVGAGEYIGIVWEAGSGATKYYSARFGSTYEAGLKGEFIFQTNPTGTSGIAALTETARIKSDGSFVHNGYHQLTSSFPITGATVPNGSIFKGTDGALYFKGGSGTVTLIAPN